MYLSCALSIAPFLFLRGSAAPLDGDLSAVPNAGGYHCFRGTSFPSPQQWKSYDELAKLYQESLGPHSSDILESIKSFTTSPSQELDVEQFQSLILVMVARESGGAGNFVGDGGLSHGLLQVQLQNPEEKPAKCEPNDCSKDKILQMLQQGVYGHSSFASAEKPGIAFYLATNSPGATLRLYNSGEQGLVDPKDFSATPDLKSTPSYVSDVANRLSGLSPKDIPDEQELLQMCGFQPPKQQ